MNNMMKWIKQRVKRSIQVLESRDAYRLWADDYQPAAHNTLMTIEEKAMIELMPSLDGKTALDLACGTGRWGVYAQKHGASAVFGTDNSWEMLKQGVLPQIAVGTLSKLPFVDGCFDVILCGLAVGHLPSDIMKNAIQEMGRVLKRDGVALVSDLHPFQALNGAQRTFQGGDRKVYAVEHYVHQYVDYHQVAREAGLRIADVREPVHPDVKMREVPIVLVLRLEKQ